MVTVALIISEYESFLGPASRNVDTLVKMIDFGMDIVRLNFSHGTHDYHRETLANVHKAAEIRSKQLGRPSPITVALDTKGPEIRTGVNAKVFSSQVLKYNITF